MRQYVTKSQTEIGEHVHCVDVRDSVMVHANSSGIEHVNWETITYDGSTWEAVHVHMNDGTKFTLNIAHK